MMTTGVRPWVNWILSLTQGVCSLQHVSTRQNYCESAVVFGWTSFIEKVI